MKPANKSALILIDLIDENFDEKSRQLRSNTLRAAENIARLKIRARKARVPVIFANDHFGNWHSDFHGMVNRCRATGGRAAELVEMLKPDASDYSVLKPRHSAFYGTPLAFILEELEVNRLILVGIEADMCVMFTANDAYIRKFSLWIPQNCVAAASIFKLKQALSFVKDNLNADIRSSRGKLSSL